MSPEQLEGIPVSGASDQFALGVVVYELLTGMKPFAAGNLASLHYLICKRPAQPVQELNPALSETVNRVMERVLAKLPEQRYSSCSEFMGALSVALGECPDWRPVAPVKTEETAKMPAAGNGWYAPETVVSSRLIEAQPADYSIVDDGVVIDADVLPPLPHNLETAVATTCVSALGQGSGREQKFEPRRSNTGGTRIRVEVERPAPRTWGWMMAACAAIALFGIILLRMLSAPRVDSATVEAKRVITGSEPEDLSTAASGARPTTAPNHAPTDLTSAPSNAVVAKPISTASDSSRTTVAVRAAAPATARQERQSPLETPVRKPAHLPAAPVAPPLPLSSDVELVSDPAGARIEVDGRSDLACLAPCSVPLPAGRHTLIAESSGYGAARKIFTVPVSGSVFVSMMKSTGTLLLTSEPAGANVMVDGKDYGSTPVRVRLSAGRHHLSLSDGLRHHDETIQIDADGMYARSFRW